MTFGPVAPGRPTCSSTTPEPDGTCADTVPASRVVAAHRAGRTRRGERSMTRRARARRCSPSCGGPVRWPASTARAGGAATQVGTLQREAAASPSRRSVPLPTCTRRSPAKGRSWGRSSESQYMSRCRTRRWSSTTSGTCRPSGRTWHRARSCASLRTLCRRRGYRSSARGSTGSCRPSWQCCTRSPGQNRPRSQLGRRSSSSARDTAPLPPSCLPQQQPQRPRLRHHPPPQPARRRLRNRPLRPLRWRRA